ncbi:MAG: hypothetical protein II463_03555, partial [Bacteroidaceae bacterium]|nr:hypothetical protein [Bacteroidaceae bacterium]
MKHKLLNKLLTLTLLILGGALFSPAWGEDTVTFSYSDYRGNGTSSSGSSYTMSKTNVSINNTKFYCGG